MLKFSVNEQEYSCIDAWEDLTISKAIKIKTLADELPQAIKDHFLQMIKPSMEKTELSQEETEILHKFWQDLLILVSDIPSEIVEQIIIDDILELCDNCLVIFVLSMLFTPLYEPKGIESFEWEGEILLLPRSGTDIMDVTTPLEKLKSKEFCEASDVGAVNDLNLAPLFVAILCRPEGEEYNEERVKERAKKMKNLYMNIYLEVFFCLVQLTTTSLKSTLAAIQKEGKKSRKKK